MSSKEFYSGSDLTENDPTNLNNSSEALRGSYNESNSESNESVKGESNTNHESERKYLNLDGSRDDEAES